jgi:branched-chain amino acid transport system substrate-binding protein
MPAPEPPSQKHHTKERNAMDWLRGMKRGSIGVTVALGISGPSVAADPGLTDNEIVIGLFGPLSGPLVGFGLDPVNAAKMWYDDINKKGGIHGRKSSRSW